jgi:hypothetical protein
VKQETECFRQCHYDDCNCIAKLTAYNQWESTEVGGSRFPELIEKRVWYQYLPCFPVLTPFLRYSLPAFTLFKWHNQAIKSESIKKYIWNDKHADLEIKFTWRTEEYGTQTVLIVQLTINQSSCKNGSHRRGKVLSGGGAF